MSDTLRCCQVSNEVFPFFVILSLHGRARDVLAPNDEDLEEGGEDDHGRGHVEVRAVPGGPTALRFQSHV